MPDLPTGTITFLFTSIEGSPTHREQRLAALQAALARHDAIMRQAIEAHRGVVFKTIGDAFYAVFATAPDALHAALTAQRALHAEDWGEADPVRVGMALHTGMAEQRDGDYFGPALNRVARLLSGGHAGQILLSLATQELVRDHLPPGVELRDLGAHRLKDLIRPEHVFQVVAPGLPADFPALRTLDIRRHNLPIQPTSLVGRDQEVAAVCARLRHADVRLLTLTGPGGSGKTRLSLQVAAELLNDFPDGVFFVELAPLSDPALVAVTTASVLGVMEAGGRPIVETLGDYLRDKQLLLVLDNFEQVVAAAPFLLDLLRTAARLKVLVTSREVLRVYGEQEHPVPPLALPDLTHLPPVTTLNQYAAVALFIQRAQAVKPDFQVTNETAPAIAEICARLDGLPLAIELAAARSKLLAPQALLARLGSRLKVLTGGARDLPARQQTLRGAIDWSYHLLDPAEQTLFARLGIFVGGCTLEAAEAVCNAEADLQVDVLDGLASLVDKSLVRQTEGADGESRFRMLETIREYALDRLAASGEADMLGQQHLTFFLQLAEAAAPALRGPEPGAWLARLEAEHDNLRAALAWSLRPESTQEGVKQALRLSVAAWGFWTWHGHLGEGRQWLALALARSNEDSAASASLASLRGVALKVAGNLAWEQGDYAAARAHAEESLALMRQLGDRPGTAGALNQLGLVVRDQGDYATARVLTEESLALMRQLGERVGDKANITWVLHNLGNLAFYEGDFAAARAFHEESLALRRELGDKGGIAAGLAALGMMALEQGDYAARQRFEDSLTLLQKLGDKQGVAECLEGLAGVAGALGGERRQPARAARLWGAAKALREAIDARQPPAQRLRCEHHLAVARAQLDEATWEAALNEGRAMPLEQAIAYALEESSNA